MTSSARAGVVRDRRERVSACHSRAEPRKRARVCPRSGQDEESLWRPERGRGPASGARPASLVDRTAERQDDRTRRGRWRGRRRRPQKAPRPARDLRTGPCGQRGTASGSAWLLTRGRFPRKDRPSSVGRMQLLHHGRFCGPSASRAAALCAFCVCRFGRPTMPAPVSEAWASCLARDAKDSSLCSE
jgi:hypothetical protein